MPVRSLSARTRNMTEGNPLATVLFFALPMIFSNVFQQLYQVADSVIVGKRLGADALAAVGNSGTVTAVFVQLATGLSLGGSVVAAQYFGAGKPERIRACAVTSVLLSAAAGLVSSATVWFGAERFLILINTPAGLVEMGARYLRLYFLGCLPIFIYNSFGGIFTALGDSRTPLWILVVSSLLNIGMDLLFILVFGWGVEGAALATALSQTVAAAASAVQIRGLLRQLAPPRSSFADRKIRGIFAEFDPDLLRAMLRMALPSALQQSIVSVGSVIVQSTVNGFGPAVMAGSAAAARVVNLASAVPLNYGNALAGYVGQNYGAARMDRIRKGLAAALVSCGLICLALTALFESCPDTLIGLFIKESEADTLPVIRIGTSYLRVVGAFLPVFSTYVLIKSVFKGSGDMGWFVAVTLLSFAIRLVLTVCLAPVWGVEIIWWSFCIGWVVSLAVTAARYVQGGWRKRSAGRV